MLGIMRRTGLLAAGVATALLATACGSGTPTPVAAGTPTATATSASPSATPSPAASPTDAVPSGPLTPKQLLAAILPYPAGATHVAVPGSKGGIFTVDTYAMQTYDNAKAGRDYLASYGFTAAAARYWRPDSSHLVVIKLLQFDPNNGTGAFPYLLDNADDELTADPAPSSHGDLPDGLNGSYYVFTKADSSGFRGVTMIAVVGNLEVVVGYGQKATITKADQAKAIALLKVQLARLA